MIRLSCTAKKSDGTACRAPAQPGSPWCRWHDPSPAARARHREESRRGGENRRQPVVALAPLADAYDVAALDLTTAAGVRGLVALALKHCASLPFATSTANAIGQLSQVQRANIEVGDI